MDNLSKLAFKYGTDKCPKIKHSYTPWYNKKFRLIRKKVRKILEIGVGDERYPIKYYHEKSASLKMWRDYFPNAMVYGLDISRRGFYEDKNIKCFFCDATNVEQLEKVLEKIGNTFDIIIDDGSHKYTDQGNTAKILLPRVNKDVKYFIEDVLEPRYLMKSLSDYKLKLIEFKTRYRDDKILIVKNK